MIEILSPVGNYECLEAAVRSGADAVYLGTAQFNARRNADNFSGDGLKKAVAYCHVRGVKVYLTLNTLLYKNELESAIEVATKAAICGVDAIICADLGLSRALKSTLPNMPLHASTQMSVHTKEALYTLKELGFSRVVPAREMSRNELQEFCALAKSLNIEVEVFIHGALCMCMSGQCLLSAHLGGRSGNRGLCAGTCRLPFSVGGKNNYALSLKDMCHIQYIKELSEMGVCSFKIEGRMKPPEYVAAATAACRQMADIGYVDPEHFKLLEQVFSRNGFTDGYYTDDNQDMFGVRTGSDLSVTRNAESKLHELYRNERQSVKISMAFCCKKGEKTSLTVNDGINTVSVIGQIPQDAISREIDADFITAQLSRLGGTPFLADDISITIERGLSLSVSNIKAMRRDAIEQLAELRAKATEPNICEINIETSTGVARNTKIYAEFLNVNSIPQNLKAVDAIIIPAEQLEQYKGNSAIIANLPRGMGNKELINKCIELCKKHGVTAICHNLAAINLCQQNGIPFVAGQGLNCINPVSSEVLLGLGAISVTLSKEAKIADKKHFDLTKNWILVYGKAQLMLTDNCPIKADVGCDNCQHKTTDRKGIEFPVFCRGGYAQLYNSRPLWLADRLNEYSGFGGFVLKFTDEKPDEVLRVISAYNKETDYKPQEYTRGLYDKGVL